MPVCTAAKSLSKSAPTGFCGIANMASVYGNIKLIRLFLHHQLAFAEYVTHIAAELKNARIMDINFAREERENYDYLKKLDRLFRDLQKIERDLIMLLKERRKLVQTGFDTLIMREDAANMLAITTGRLTAYPDLGKFRYTKRYMARDSVWEISLHTVRCGEKSTATWYSRSIILGASA